MCFLTPSGSPLPRGRDLWIPAFAGMTIETAASRLFPKSRLQGLFILICVVANLFAVKNVTEVPTTGVPCSSPPYHGGAGWGPIPLPWRGGPIYRDGVVPDPLQLPLAKGERFMDSCFRRNDDRNGGKPPLSEVPTAGSIYSHFCRSEFIRCKKSD